jgi:hypothetical protein
LQNKILGGGFNSYLNMNLRENMAILMEHDLVLKLMSMLRVLELVLEIW